MWDSCQKRLIRLVSTLHGIAKCIKNGTVRKNVPPAYGSISPQCHPQLLSDRFENLLHNVFRNENSTLETNVSLFGVLHWQQWQPPASTSGQVEDDYASEWFILHFKFSHSLVY